MKKFIAALLASAMLFSLAACGKDKTEMNIYGIKGPTSVGLVSLMDKQVENYHFKIVGSPEEIVGKIATGEVDIAAVPTNLAATLYKKTNGNIKMLAINTLGVLSILENGNTIKTVEDLKGKTIYSIGQGSNPEYILNYILKANNIEAEIKFVSTNDELSALLIQGSAMVAMVAEPAATAVLQKKPELRRALDINKAWNDVDSSESLAMGCLVARKDFLESNPAAIKNFLKEYKDSIKATEDLEKVAPLTVKYDILPSDKIAKLSIPNCNLVYIDGKDMMLKANNYFKVLFESNPVSIGGQMPNEDLFFVQ